MPLSYQRNSLTYPKTENIVPYRTAAFTRPAAATIIYAAVFDNDHSGSCRGWVLI
jgi:hypothetical protein